MEERSASTVENENDLPNLPSKGVEKDADSVTSLKGQEIDHANLYYEGDVCIYTEPESKYQYMWDTVKKEWVPKLNNNKEGDTVEKESQSTIGSVLQDGKDPGSKCVSNSQYQFDGESYFYTDPKTGISYKYDENEKTWVTNDELKEAPSKDKSDIPESSPIKKQDMTSGTYSYEGDTHIYTDSDGSVYIWDKEKSAWFPKVDDDFLAMYQMNYGFTDPNANDSKKAEEDKKKEEEKKREEAKKKEDEEALKKKAGPQEASWFELDAQSNTKVYVSNLPLDITEQEFVDVMQKCGLVMKDADTGRMKVKLYSSPDGSQLKGDGLCTYIRVESVDLALSLIDGSDLRGHKLRVERARFQMKGSYDPSLKPKKRRRKDKDKLRKIQDSLLDWRPDKLRGARSKHERVVILKNVFEPSLFDKDVALILEYQQDIREEGSKCGDVRKVVIYDRHPDGVAQVTFAEPEEADACIQLLNGRWFGQRQITAETWDGKTKYKVVETEAETEQRLQKWSKYLEAEEEKERQKKENESKLKSEGRQATQGGQEESEDIGEKRRKRRRENEDTGSSADSNEDTEEEGSDEEK